MQKADVRKLTESQETLLIALWARATEAGHPEPILRDDRAVELFESIDYPFEKFVEGNTRYIGFCIRAAIFDRLVRRFLEEHPSGTVVEIGAGLDTRFDRLDNGTVRWFDLDLPDAMEVRRGLIEETPRRKFLGTSVVEPEWLDELADVDPSEVLFIAEGVLYFVPGEEVSALFTRLADRFPGAKVLFDCMSPLYLMANNIVHPLDGVKLLWSVGRRRDIERWDPRLEIEEFIGFGDAPYYDRNMLDRLSWYQRLGRRFYPPARNMFRICQVHLAEEATWRRKPR